MRMVELIEKKKLGSELSKEEISWMIEQYSQKEIPDYQMSAFLMSVYFQGMTDEEVNGLTFAMAHSGDVIDLSGIEGIKVDKHSTGGVGDTTTLVLAPLVASVGVPVAKMSGRGLGHTGGTIDKFEAIKGFDVEMSEEKFIQSVNDIGVAVVGQSANLAPADKLLYALRDVTATVDSMPLIASSIMSKKIASGADAIVLDVTTGEGAFMKDVEDAKKLAHIMVRLGNLAKRKTVAVISDMSQPLGEAIGNSLEILEALDVLKGGGPDDLREMVLVLGSQMLILAGKTTSTEVSRQLLEEAIASGKALEKFREMVENQGGDSSFIESPELLMTANYQFELPAKTSGVVTKLVADKIGVAAMLLGAGRKTKEDSIDFGVGLILHKKVGDIVEVGESLVTIYSNSENIEEVKNLLYENIKIGDKAVEPPLIHAVITD
ncbi:MAG: pyrimidine-nucleoside phosphorylase [Lactobacillales bacterium]|jgi:pyrimidine-nucleoside phosphorylase|nr:pyrimidine-nucleoside phosphorylase [Lactobacillales bacterium]